MIPSVSGARIEAERVGLLSFEHVLCDVSRCPLEWVSRQSEHTQRRRRDVDVAALESAGALRLDPRASPANLRLDSVAVAARELRVLEDQLEKDEHVAVVADVTTVDEGADVEGLRRVDELLGRVHVVRGASTARAASDDVDAAARALRRQFLAVEKAAFISVKLLGGELDSLDSLDVDGRLLAAAKAASGGRVLVVVTLPRAESDDALRLAARAARAALGDDDTPTLLRSPRRSVVDSPGAYVVVDGFGRPFEADHFSDLARLAAAKKRKDRALLSVGVRHKNQLLTFGGFGYAYAAELLLSVGDDDDDETRRLLLANPNVVRALCVAVEPKVEPVRVPTVRCSLCDGAFPRLDSRQKKGGGGFYYAKYDYVYCGRPCLDRHRLAGFAATDLAGPLASAQKLY
mmetsp:Transcript_22204/g.68362  ORF Transcript_22204/g.68362 Transcript_22204/m.68362 type:complete len:404 (+) Transcript_22204:47-1258(+)